LQRAMSSRYRPSIVQSLVFVSLFLAAAYLLTGSSSKSAQLSSMGNARSQEERSTVDVLQNNTMETQQDATGLTLVALSDTHGLHVRPDLLAVPPGDVLLFAGDAGIEDAHDVEQFEKWLATLPHPHKVVTFGNMDFYTEKAAQGKPSIGLQGASVACNNGIVEVAGLRILGSASTPKFYGSFQFPSEAAAQAHWQQLLPKDARIDVLLTHGPPHGYGDTTKGRHVGDKALLDAVMALEQPPKLWLCGHIHDGRGAYDVPHPRGTIKLINVAVAYVARGESDKQPFIIRLPGLDVSVGSPPAAQAGRQVQGEVWRAPVTPVM